MCMANRMMYSRSGALALFAFSLLAASACSQDATEPADGSAKLGRWGSAEALLTTTETGATLDVVASGCIGSYGDIQQRIPAGDFTLTGTFTQLMGAYPGMVVYPAQFKGSAGGDTVVITITANGQTRGPFTVVYGRGETRSRCLYP